MLGPLLLVRGHHFHSSAGTFMLIIAIFSLSNTAQFVLELPLIKLVHITSYAQVEVHFLHKTEVYKTCKN